jgi:hypothetical protein
MAMTILRLETLLLAAGASLLVATALAQSDSAFEGTYRLTIDREAAQARIERAIEAATDDMGPLREAVATNRLEDRNPVIEELAIDLREDTVGIRYGDERFDLPRGRFGPVPVPGGETAQARARIRANRLLVDWRMEDGRRHDVFRLNGDRLILTLRTTSEKLPDDVLYRLPFRRTD